jgi:hypothetical protein
MKITVTKNMFENAFVNANREKQFPNCVDDLFDYLEEEEESTGEEIELDVIDLCCTYSEYENMNAFLIDYPDFKAETFDEELDFDETLKNIQNKTVVIGNPQDEDDPFIIETI